MSEILLVRHGTPLCDHRTKVRGCDFGAWVAAYDCAALDLSKPPSCELRAKVATASCIVTSTLRRSIESAALVAGRPPFKSDALFDEAGIPTSIPFRFSLSPGYWDILARAAWFFGWSPGVECYRAAKRRALRAAAELERLSYEYGSVVLFGHGMLNTLIGHGLRRSGWVGKGSPRTYWGSVLLRK